MKINIADQTEMQLCLLLKVHCDIVVQDYEN